MGHKESTAEHRKALTATEQGRWPPQPRSSPNDGLQMRFGINAPLKLESLVFLIHFKNKATCIHSTCNHTLFCNDCNRGGIMFPGSAVQLSSVSCSQVCTRVLLLLNMQFRSRTRQEPKASEWCQFPFLPSLPEDVSLSLSHLWNVMTIPVSLTCYRNEVKGYVESIYSDTHTNWSRNISNLFGCLDNTFYK